MSQRSLQNSKAKPLSSLIHTRSCVISHRCEPRSLPLSSAVEMGLADRQNAEDDKHCKVSPQVAGTQTVDPAPFELHQASGAGCEARGLRMPALSDTAAPVSHPPKASVETDLLHPLLNCLLSSHRDRERLWVHCSRVCLPPLTVSHMGGGLWNQLHARHSQLSHQ